MRDARPDTHHLARCGQPLGMPAVSFVVGASLSQALSEDYVRDVGGPQWC